MSLRVEYFDVPAIEQEQLGALAEGGQPFSDPDSVISGSKDVAYATLEDGGWPLDGTRQLMKDTPGTMWWSEAISDDTGSFAQPPVLTLSCDEAITTTGLTVTFWPATEQWCSRLKVSWYNGTVLLTEAIANPDSPKWTLEKTVEGFDRVKLELLETNQPRQFAKLQKLELGQVWVFEKDELVSVQLVNEIDPTLCDMTVDTMRIVLRSRSAASLAPQENQALVLYRDGKRLATHYITGSSREEKNLYTLEAQSAIGMLEDTFLGDMYDEMPLQSLLYRILPDRAFRISSVFEDVTVSGHLPVCTRREALQQIAFAVGAVISAEADGTVYVRPLAQKVQGRFPAEQIFHGAKVTTRPRYCRVEVAAHSYSPSDEEKVLLENEEIYGEDVLVTFDEPYHSYQITGGELTQYGANYIRVTAQGPVTVTARPYIHSTVLHTKYDPRAVSGDSGNVLTVDSATLVGSGNVAAVLQRTYETAQLRQELTQEAVLSGQQAGQQVSAVNPWGTQTRGYIASMESNLTEQGQTAQLKILGVEVMPEYALRYAGEFYAGEEEVLC